MIPFSLFYLCVVLKGRWNLCLASLVFHPLTKIADAHNLCKKLNKLMYVLPLTLLSWFRKVRFKSTWIYYIILQNWLWYFLWPSIFQFSLQKRGMVGFIRFLPKNKIILVVELLHFKIALGPFMKLSCGVDFFPLQNKKGKIYVGWWCSFG